MTLSAAVITTFPNSSWDVYSKKMLQSFMRNWPEEIPLLISLDDDLLLNSVQKWIRSQDAIAVGWGKEHREFVERNRGKDDPADYRKMPVRFCHKVFAIARAFDSVLKQKKDGDVAPRYLIWMDADVLIHRNVTLDEIRECLPKEGDSFATLGRKDWPHSECGWMAFDLENKGSEIIIEMFKSYVSDEILKQAQQDDSWMWDEVVKKIGCAVTNLTEGAPGLDVWQFSPMAKWSRHYKGPAAKQELLNMPRPAQTQGNVTIQTRNAIPNEKICANIAANQKLIKNWIKPCKKHDEEIIIVSAGPMLIAEDLRKEQKAGKKIIAVKHALEPLKNAGIKPWASILLDPREHVNNFVQNPDKDIIWFVASQVNPEVVRTLILAGCTVWGYHASVGAGEVELTNLQPYSVVSGGSATATRGLFVMNHLGFNKFRLYGYNLCHGDKPDLNAKDELGQPKYMEISIAFDDKNMHVKRHFWTEPQLIAQFEEMNDLIKSERFDIEAYGEGVIPFLIKSKKTSDLRNKEIAAKMLGGKTPTYKELLGWTSKTNWRRLLPKTLHKRSLASK